jgi:hypothetical protein
MLQFCRFFERSDIMYESMRGIAGPLRLGCLAGGIAAISLTAGCITVIDGDSSVSATGRYVAEGTMDQIKPGETTAQWVEAALGTPTTTITLDDGSEIWRWQWQRTRHNSTEVFLLIDSSGTRRTGGTAWVQIRDGIVVKKGRDQPPVD